MALELGQMDVALEHLQRGLDLRLDLGSPGDTTLSYQGLADYRFRAGQYDRAMEYAALALQLACEAGARPAEARAPEIARVAAAAAMITRHWWTPWSRWSEGRPNEGCVIDAMNTEQRWQNRVLDGVYLCAEIGLLVALVADLFAWLFGDASSANLGRLIVVLCAVQMFLIALLWRLHRAGRTMLAYGGMTLLISGVLFFYVIVYGNTGCHLLFIGLAVFSVAAISDPRWRLVFATINLLSMVACAVWLNLAEPAWGIAPAAARQHFSTNAVILAVAVLAIVAYLVRLNQQRESQLVEAARSLEFTRSALDHAADMVFWHTLEDGKIVYVNRTVTRRLGYSLDELRSMKVRDFDLLFPAERWPAYAEELTRMESMVFDGVHRSRDGQTCPVEITAQAVDFGGQMHVIATGRDVRERKEYEASLKRAREAAEVANRAKSIFLANMSHEIRTPMNAVLGYAQLLDRDRALGGEQRRAVRAIHRAGEHLLSLIDDVLEMSKIEAGRLELRLEPFDLYTMLDGLDSMFEAQARDRGLQLVIERSAQLPRHLESDQGKVRQVAVNLVGNALKFTSAGSVHVEVHAAGSEGGRSTITLAVTDTGRGLAEGDLERVFEAFERTPDQRQRVEGTGLGLSIARRYARLLGGDITVVSELDRGSTFTFTFEARHCETPSTCHEHRRRVVGLADPSLRVRVLVVDDHEANRDLLTRMLEPLGFALESASCGEEAIAAFRREPARIVLMDVRMPGMDGVQASRAIRALEGGDEAVIVAVSASAMADQRESVLEHGADAFVRKPFREADLLATLAEHAGLRYRFEDEPTGPDDEAIDPASLKRFTEVPEEQRAALANAVLLGDSEQISSVIRAIGSSEPALAGALDELARQYDYETLVTLCDADPQE